MILSVVRMQLAADSPRTSRHHLWMMMIADSRTTAATTEPNSSGYMHSDDELSVVVRTYTSTYSRTS